MRDDRSVPVPEGLRRSSRSRRLLPARAFALVLCSAATLLAQSEVSRTACEFAVGPVPATTTSAFLCRIEPPLLRAAFVHCAEVLASADVANTSPRQRASLLLGWLRLDQPFGARRLLQVAAEELLDEAGAADEDGAAWFVVQSYWTWRALRDEALLLATAGAFERARSGLLATDLPEDPERAGLHVHALACAESLSCTLGDTEAALACGMRARRRLDEHESRHWQETLGCFATPGSAPSLFGCSIGMLAATADRMDRHVRAALATASPFDADQGLVARTQFDLARERELESACRAPVPDAVTAGARLDALAFAATGLRLATAPGLDERWTRLRPCLLPGSRRLHVGTAACDGWRIEFSCERIEDAMVLHARLQPEADRATWRQLVAHLDGAVHVAAARADVALELRSRPATPGRVTSPDR